LNRKPELKVDVEYTRILALTEGEVGGLFGTPHVFADKERKLLVLEIPVDLLFSVLGKTTFSLSNLFQ
jgi:hypothetical protein